MTRLAAKAVEAWPAANRRFYDEFCRWMRQGGYSDATIYLYGRVARLALGWLDLDYRRLDPATDLERVRRVMASHYRTGTTCQTYGKGLAKLAQYLRFRCGWPDPIRAIRWDYYLGRLPGWLAAELRAYVSFRQRNWLREERRRATGTLLSHLSLTLRWVANRVRLARLTDLTPGLWHDYVDARLAAGIKPSTLNRELRDLKHFLRHLADEGRPIRHDLLRIEPLRSGLRLPRDLPLATLRRLLRQVEATATSADAHTRRQGLLDRAWLLLMLHSGLRSGEIRRLRLADLDTLASPSAGLEARRVKIVQSKGLKDRLVCLSPEAAQALRAYLAVRGPSSSAHVFLYRHRPLSFGYCGQRLRTYGRCCGLRASPHQLRHSCATLLLNAGAPVLTVQAILGHERLDTTLGYARLYDRTLADDYCAAMEQVERRLDTAIIPPETDPDGTPASNSERAQGLEWAAPLAARELDMGPCLDLVYHMCRMPNRSTSRVEEWPMKNETGRRPRPPSRSPRLP